MPSINGFYDNLPYTGERAMSNRSEFERRQLGSTLQLAEAMVFRRLAFALRGEGLDLVGRACFVTVLFNAYGAPSTVIVEYLGSPTKCTLMFPWANPAEFKGVDASQIRRTVIADALSNLMQLPQLMSMTGTEDKFSRPIHIRFGAVTPYRANHV